MLKLSQAQLNAIEEQATYELARRDFSYFVDVDSEFRDRDGAHLDVLDETLIKVSEGTLKRVIVTMPPRHGKSERVSKKFPAWHVGRNPGDEIILASYSVDLSRGFSRIARDTLIANQDMFGINVDPANQSAESWGTEGYRGGVTAAGVGGAITGKGAKIAIIDDPVKNAEEADSETMREKIWEWYTSTLYTRLTPDGRIIVVMTRWHEDDLVGRLLKKEADEIAEGTHKGERWTVINFPALAEKDDYLGRAEGEPLWPEFGFDQNRMEQIKVDVGSRVFNALYQQRPSAADGNFLKRDWWRYYENPPIFASMLISVDAAFKDEDDSDYVVIQAWGRTGPNMYLVDQVRAKLNFPATLQSIRNMVAKYPEAHLKLIEDKANGSAIIQTLQREIPGILGINPEGGKVARVNAVSAYIESGNVYLPRTSWTQDFVEEAASFPNGKNDDQVDAMSQALHRFIYVRGDLPNAPKVPTPFPFQQSEDYQGGFQQW
ncbi:phage terminase large subunit [Paenibacillus harenae]|uniref:phage terminase large subunit n=1 Tax=Paenibacillus harenae TaxID=306543 RepID=UPI0003FEF6DE|nr:phage terminase large subunit [Paenibacillus harenae]